MSHLDDMLQQADGLVEAERYREAFVLYDMILKANPKAVAAFSGAGICNARTGHSGVAIGLFNAALMLAPKEPTLWANLGLALRHCGHVEWARAAYQKALGFDPKIIQGLVGMAGSYVNEGHPSPGIEWARKALAVEPDNNNAAQELALCLMELGKWKEAWPFWRRRMLHGHAPRKYPGDYWRGEDVDWLIVHGEQGLGDEVMFLGCLPQLMDRAHSGVVIEVNPKLVEIVRQSFPQAVVIGAESELNAPLVGVVAHTKLGDLAEHCEGGKPPKVSGYLQADWVPGYDDAVLIAHMGGSSSTHDYLRNPPVEAWAPVVDAIRAAGLRPVSIQYGPNGPPAAAVMGIDYDATASGDANLTRQAQAIRSARALVSVQQTALHLGGALGARTVGVVADKPAWRYGLAGPMPWYQTVDLHRVKPDDDSWAPVMKRVAATVATMATEKAA